MKEIVNLYPYLKYKEKNLKLYDLDAYKLGLSYPTPFYIYLRQRFIDNYKFFKKALSASLPQIEIFYAVKANYMGKILCDAKSLDMGLEVMSLFEIKLAEKAGFSFEELVFNGPAKSKYELNKTISSGISYLNIESVNELKLVEKIAKKHSTKQNITVRIHPRLSKKTENKLLIKKNSKLGIDYNRARTLYSYAKRSEYLEPTGVHIHVGTNLTSHSFYEELLSFLEEYLLDLKKDGIEIKEVNLGGGLASRKKLEQEAFELEKFGEQIAYHLKNSDELKFLFEPGRFLIEDSFVALTKVLRTKKTWGRKWAFTDIGANTLIPLRYTIYEALPTIDKGKGHYCNIGGPLCLPVDVLTNKAVDFQIEEEDILLILNCGAYTLSMSEQFGYPRPAVYEFDGNEVLTLIKESDNIEKMVEEAF